MNFAFREGQTAIKKTATADMITEGNGQDVYRLLITTSDIIGESLGDTFILDGYGNSIKSPVSQAIHFIKNEKKREVLIKNVTQDQQKRTIGVLKTDKLNFEKIKKNIITYLSKSKEGGKKKIIDSMNKRTEDSLPKFKNMIAKIKNTTDYKNIAEIYYNLTNALDKTDDNDSKNFFFYSTSNPSPDAIRKFNTNFNDFYDKYIADPQKK